MNLAGGFDKVLEVSASKEVPQIDKLAMGFIFDIDNAPTILATTDLPPINYNVLFTADDSKWNDILLKKC